MHRGLDETIRDARMLTLRGFSLPETTPNDHERLKKLNPPFLFRVALKTKEIMIEEELRVRRSVLYNDERSLKSYLSLCSSSFIRNPTICLLLHPFAIDRARKMTMIAEGTEAKRQEDAITKRKRELEDKKRWEGSSMFLAACFALIIPRRPGGLHLIDSRIEAVGLGTPIELVPLL